MINVDKVKEKLAIKIANLDLRNAELEAIVEELSEKLANATADDDVKKKE